MDHNDRHAIEGLFGKLSAAERQAGPRDPEAEAFIRDRMAAQPAAPYLMAQTIVVQEQALNAAQQRIEQLEYEMASQPQQSSGGGLFSSLFGSGSRPAAPQRPRRAAPGMAGPMVVPRLPMPLPAPPAHGASRAWPRNARQVAAVFLPVRRRPRWASLAASCSATPSRACSAATPPMQPNRRRRLRRPKSPQPISAMTRIWATWSSKRSSIDVSISKAAPAFRRGLSFEILRLFS